MNFEGISGDVTAGGFTGDIQLLGFQWGVNPGISSSTGGSADGASSAPSASDITITKAVDKTSSLLLREMLTGESKDVKIFFVNSIKGRLNTYAEYDLKNVLISGYPGAGVIFGATQHLESLSIGANGSAVFAAGSGKVLFAGGLAIGGTAAAMGGLDLADSDLVLD
jgi:type VI protein secretion system component Hcp